MGGGLGNSAPGWEKQVRHVLRPESPAAAAATATAIDDDDDDDVLHGSPAALPTAHQILRFHLKEERGTKGVLRPSSWLHRRVSE